MSGTSLVDAEDLDTFISLTKQHGVEEADRRLRKWLGDDRVRALRRAYEERVRHLIDLRDPPGLDPDEIDGWYAGPQQDDRFWPAVYESLIENDWVPKDLQNLDKASSKVVARMSQPIAPSFKTKGLVVGYVQSGKTTNFTSVIAKAADVGYRFFIVLSGIHNGLREQTQARLSAALVEKHPSHWLPLTGSGRDFTAPENATVYLSQEGENFVLCVVKKNASRLRNLPTEVIDWLARNTKSSGKLMHRAASRTVMGRSSVGCR